jgi:hypothetical protein
MAASSRNGHAHTSATVLGGVAPLQLGTVCCDHWREHFFKIGERKQNRSAQNKETGEQKQKQK